MVIIISDDMTPGHLFSKRHMVHVDVECGKFQRCLGGGSRQLAPTTESGGNPTDRPAVTIERSGSPRRVFSPKMFQLR